MRVATELRNIASYIENAQNLEAARLLLRAAVLNLAEQAWKGEP
jgi:hypothetical protein